MSGCFGDSAYDRYLEALVDEYCDVPDEDEEEDPRDEYYPEDKDELL